MKPRYAAVGLVAAAYLSCLAIDIDQPWGAPTPLAHYAEPREGPDERPFWVRLLLSLRWDFLNKQLTGEAEF